MKLEIFRLIFEKCPNIKLDENPTSWNRAVTFGQSDMKKQIVAFRNSAHAPENDLRLAAQMKGMLIGEFFHKRTTF